MEIKTVEAIIEAFGGPTKFGRAIGQTPQAAFNMQERRSINSRHWNRLVAEAKERGIEGVTLERLAELHKSSSDPVIEPAAR